MHKHPFPPTLPERRPYDVSGLGAHARDYLLRVPRHPAPGEKLRFGGYHHEGGGQAATALVAVARLGYRALYLGGVGADPDGEMVLSGLRAEGVDVGQVRVRSGGVTQRAMILVEEDTGERTIIWGRSEGMVLAPDEIDADQISSGRILHCDAQDPRTAARAAPWAHQAGMAVMADLELVRPGLEEFLPHLDYLVAAKDFPELATGSARMEEALQVLEERTGGALVVVTLGGQGAVARLEGRLRRFPAYAVDAIDTTGAGDVFHGAFAVAAMQGMALAEALDFCNAVAAMKCLALGGRAGIPRDCHAVERFRRETPLVRA